MRIVKENTDFKISRDSRHDRVTYSNNSETKYKNH